MQALRHPATMPTMPDAPDVPDRASEPTSPTALEARQGMQKLAKVVTADSEATLERARKRTWGDESNITTDDLQILRQLQMWLLRSLNTEDPDHWRTLEQALRLFEDHSNTRAVEAVRATTVLLAGDEAAGLAVPERLDMPAMGSASWPRATAEAAPPVPPPPSDAAPALAHAAPKGPMPTHQAAPEAPLRVDEVPTTVDGDGGETIRVRVPPPPGSSPGTAAPMASSLSQPSSHDQTLRTTGGAGEPALPFSQSDSYPDAHTAAMEFPFGAEEHTIRVDQLPVPPSGPAFMLAPPPQHQPSHASPGAKPEPAIVRALRRFSEAVADAWRKLQV